MRTVDGYFLCSVVGLIIVSAVLSRETTIFNLLPTGAVEQEISANLPLPLEVMDVLFVVGAVLSAFAWGRSSRYSLVYLGGVGFKARPTPRVVSAWHNQVEYPAFPSVKVRASSARTR